MTDTLEQASALLCEKKCSLALINKSTVFTSEKRGISPLMDLLKNKSDIMKNASAADKVVGKAAALMFIKGGIKELYADVISEHALSVLNKTDIIVAYNKCVPYIVNRDGTDMCPMEKCVLETDDIELAYHMLQKRLGEMTRKQDHRRAI